MVGYVNNETECYQAMYEIFSEKLEFAYSHKKKCYYIKAGSGFDIETTNIVENDECVFAYTYHWQFSFKDHVIMGRKLETMLFLFRSISEFINSITYKNKKVRLLVLDANLGFEFQFCKKYWFELGLDEFFCKEPRNPLKVLIGECIEMREVIGLFGKSLSHIAKNYCKTQKLKGDLDYKLIRNSLTKMDPKTEIKYCVNDVKILSELGEYIFTICYGKMQDLPLTSTGFIRNAIKRRIGTKRMKFIKECVFASLPSEHDYKKHRRYLFKGGLCGSNDLYSDEVLYHCFCADLTSDYPAQMFHKKFPYGKCLKCNPDEFCSENIPYIAHVVFYNLESYTTHSILSSHKAVNEKELNNSNSTIDNGRIWKADKIETYINDVELKGLMKAYDFSEMEVLECWKFDEYRKAPKYLLDELEVQYRTKSKLKMEGKHEIKEFVDDYRTAKEFCNGIYGMCATSIFPDEKTLDGTENVNVVIKENAKTFEQACSSMFLSPYIAFWVTSYARNILMDFISKFPDIIIQYDTDSLYFKGGRKESENLLKALEEYNEKIYAINDAIFQGDAAFKTLGSWDIEKPILRFKGMGAKRYMKQYAGNNDLFHIKHFARFYSVDFQKIEKPIYKIDFHKKHLHRKLKLVCVGCKEAGFKKQFKDVPESEIFDCFTNRMVISPENSFDLDAKYIDDDITYTITDFNGDAQICNSKSCVVLKDSAYSMKLSPSHIDFIRTRKEDRKV